MGCSASLHSWWWLVLAGECGRNKRVKGEIVQNRCETGKSRCSRPTCTFCDALGTGYRQKLCYKPFSAHKNLQKARGITSKLQVIKCLSKNPPLGVRRYGFRPILPPFDRFLTTFFRSRLQGLATTRNVVMHYNPKKIWDVLNISGCPKFFLGAKFRILTEESQNPPSGV